LVCIAIESGICLATFQTGKVGNCFQSDAEPTPTLRNSLPGLHSVGFAAALFLGMLETEGGGKKTEQRTFSLEPRLTSQQEEGMLPTSWLGCVRLGSGGWWGTVFDGLSLGVSATSITGRTLFLGGGVPNCEVD